MVVLYDSLQLAHKCILNSFYGYVMRKGYDYAVLYLFNIFLDEGFLKNISNTWNESLVCIDYIIFWKSQRKMVLNGNGGRCVLHWC